MRSLFALALVAGALALAAGHPIQVSYAVKVANVPNKTANAIHVALNGPPRWTQEPVGNVTRQMPRDVPATHHYTDIEENSDAVWFGINVPGTWILPSTTEPFYWGGLNSPTKWSPGPAYVVDVGQYEVIPVRENFTDSSSDISYYFMINRPTNSNMMRYRLNWDADGPHWWWFGTGTQFWTGSKMTGEADVQNGASFPVVKEGDAIAMVVRVSGTKMVEYTGQQIKSAFNIGSSYIEQTVDIPEVA